MRQAQRRLGSIGYGEGADTAAIQAGAPLSATGGAAGIQPTAMQAPRPKLVPIDAPTQRPDEPITAGMPFGEGPGPEALPNFRQQEADIVMKYLPSLNALAEEPDTPQSFRLFVKNVICQIYPQPSKSFHYFLCHAFFWVQDCRLP